MPRQITIIYNPTAGRRRRGRLASVVRALRRRGCQIRLKATRCRGDAERYALALCAPSSPAEIIAIAGGDGTINEVVNGIARAAPDQRRPVALIPLGTVNLLANELTWPRDPDGVAAAIATGVPREMFAADVNGRLFMTTAGIGFDADTVAAVNPGLKRRIGRLAYVVAGVSRWLAGTQPMFDVAYDHHRAQAHSVLFANGRYYAGRMVWAPRAQITDRTLYVGVFPRGGRLAVALYTIAIACGLVRWLPGVVIAPVQAATVTDCGGRPIQCDGDIVGDLPARFHAATQSLQIILPTATS